MSRKLQNLRILCVEDNKRMQQIYAVSLSSMGFQSVRFANDGGEALSLMSANEFDVVFCDLGVEPLDGLAFLKSVREAEDMPYQNTPIVMVSCHTDSADIKAARDAGATNFLCKPVSVENLYRQLDRIFEASPRLSGRAEGPIPRQQTLEGEGAKPHS